MEEDDRQRPARQLLARPKLDDLGIAELDSYIAALREEILRAEAEIARKRGHRSSAEAVFGRM